MISSKPSSQNKRSASAAVIITMQDVIKGFLGWLMHVQELAVGNRVTIETSDGALTGDIVDITMFTTTLLLCRSQDMKNIAQVGKTVRLPNATLLLCPIVNYSSTSDFLRVELPVIIKDTAQWKKAKTLFEKILQEYTNGYFEAAKAQVERRTRKFFFPPEFAASSVFMELGAEGVIFTLCFNAPLRRRRDIVTRLTEIILDRCHEAKIEIAAGTVTDH